MNTDEVLDEFFLKNNTEAFNRWCDRLEKLHSFRLYDALSYLWLSVRNTQYMAAHPDGGGGWPNLRGWGNIFWTFRWTVRNLTGKERL